MADPHRVSAHGGRDRAVRWAMALVLLVAVAGAVAVIKAALDRTAPIVPECRVTVATPTVIDQEQAANATTITAVAKRLGLPDHAATIAIAAALQESKLHNLPYGDRDSLGLFQQRPSQGWGTPAQLLTPRYAAAAFFKALAKIHGWQTMAVTEAAQAVQHSSAPDAYARWATLARDLAIATTGEQAAGLTCQFPAQHPKQAPASPVATLTQDLGSATLSAPGSASRGWTIATWLVGHATEFDITSIMYAGRQWTPDGKWGTVSASGAGVQFTQAAVKP